MATYSDTLKNDFHQFIDDLTSFLNDHCEVVENNSSGDGVSFHGPPGTWRKLDRTGQISQAALQGKFIEISEKLNLTKCLLAESNKKKIENIISFLDKMVNQEFHFQLNVEDCILEFAAKLDQLDHVLDLLPTTFQGESIVIPDTSALYNYSQLHEWTFPEIDKFCMIILPTVLQEIDEHKDDSGKGVAHEKAKSISRQIKEFRRRGKLTEGVALSGDNTIRWISEEPDFTNLPSSLDPSRNDDRIIASIFNQCRQYVHAEIYFVTCDHNLQAKAEGLDIQLLDLNIEN